MKNGFENILREEMFADFKWNPNFLNVCLPIFIFAGEYKNVHDKIQCYTKTCLFSCV